MGTENEEKEEILEDGTLNEEQETEEIPEDECEESEDVSDGAEDAEPDGDAEEEPQKDSPENRRDDISSKDRDNSGASESKESGFFKKKKKKDKKDEKIEELEDRVRRQLAEFDNFRKRTEKEKAHMYEVGAREVIEKILPVVDNFERGLAAVPEEEKENPVIEGMDKTYRQLMDVLAGLGVEVIEAEGKEFDPNLHNAVMHVEDESLGENVVVQEFQKGYKYKDTVVRHSMVQVAN